MADHHDHHNDYVHGEMDISQHKHSYELFADLTKWGCLHLAVVLVFIIVLTCIPGAGLIPAFISAAVVGVLGFILLKKKPDSH